MIDVVAVDSSNFEKEVLQAELPVIVEFWTEGCKPCKQLGKVIRSLSGALKIVTCNIDENPDLGTKFGIRNVPSLLFFRGGHVVDTAVGYMSDISEAEVMAKCDALLKPTV